MNAANEVRYNDCLMTELLSRLDQTKEEDPEIYNDLASGLVSEALDYLLNGTGAEY